MRQIHEVERVLREWDPIGIIDDLVADGLPPNEYDNYAPHIVGLLQSDTTVEDLAAHLRYCRTGAIGLPADDAGDALIANRLMEWWQNENHAAAIDRNALEGPTRVIRLDGSGWHTENDFYAAIFLALEAPSWHGRNLDALNDTLAGNDINGVRQPLSFIITSVSSLPTPVRELVEQFRQLVLELKFEGHGVDISYA